MKIKSLHRQRLALAGIATLAAASSLVAGSAVSANAVTVPNQFIRSCTWSCSAYWQSNGAYKSSVPSVCYTSHWGGPYQYDKTVWGPCR